MEKNREKTYMSLITATVFWGIQPLCIKLIMVYWSPAALTSMRYFFISLILFFIIYLRSEPRFFLPAKFVIPVLLMGLTGIAINNIAQFTGLKYSTITNCTLIASVGPSITALMAAIFLKERLSFLQWLGIILSLCGALLLFTEGNIDILLNFSFNQGDILFFICQVVWALYSFIGVKVMQSLSVFLVTAWAGLFGAILTAVYALYTDELYYTPLPLPAIYAFTFIVLLGGVCSMVCWNIGVKNAGPSLSAVFANITPLVGIFCGVWFFSESFGMLEFFGAAAIFGGVYMTTHNRQIAVCFQHLHILSNKVNH